MEMRENKIFVLSAVVLLVIFCGQEAEGAAKCVPTCTKGYQCVSANSCAPNTVSSLCPVPNSDFDTTVCATWQAIGLCLSDPSNAWKNCATSCKKYATCECDVPVGNPSDMNCTCGDYASIGLCETDPSVFLNCSYTCGRRSDPANACTPVPVTPLPPNAVWKTSGPFGDRAAYLQPAMMVCGDGFLPEIPSYTALHICDPFTPNAVLGNWLQIDTDYPNCTIQQCFNPPNVPYANYTAQAEYFYGDRVSYKCATGMSLTNAIIPEAICTSSGWTWIDKVPQCEYSPCKVPTNGLNAYYNISRNATGGIATYTCVVGYSANVSKDWFIKLCQANGTWLPTEQPQCSVATCPPPKVEDYSYYVGADKTTYRYADTVTAYCTKGAKSLYLEPGSENTPLSKVNKTCTETGTWSDESLSCLLVPCPSPPSFEISSYKVRNSSAEVATLVYGVIIAFECDYTQGYELSPNQSSPIAYWRCNENSTWDKETIKCEQSGLFKSLSSAETAKFESVNAAVTGTTIVVILFFFLGLVVCLDYMTLMRDFVKLKQNVSHFVKRIRDKHRADELRHVRHRVKNKLFAENKLQRMVEDKEKRLMAASGLIKTTSERQSALVPNPLLSESYNARPLSASNMFAKRQDHVEGEMDVPESVELRLGTRN